VLEGVLIAALSASGANGLATAGISPYSFAMFQMLPFPPSGMKLWGSNDGRNWTLIESSAYGALRQCAEPCSNQAASEAVRR
jgi:hypothetical protein